jgi:FkbM family methyltransferase
MHRLHASLVRPGGLVFDVGSHVGDRIASFRRLGCRVVAVEPHPTLARLLRLLYGRDDQVIVEDVAVAASSGTIELCIDRDNLMVSTASRDFRAAASGAPGWDGLRWEQSITVAAETLDRLIARHGVPAFIKLDVEGFEGEALAGLTAAVPALSFEFTTIRPSIALGCIARCGELGAYRFNASLGETQRLVHPAWLTPTAIASWLTALPRETNSGDIYARLAPAPSS